MTDPALVARYRAGAVTTVVDAVHGADQLANQSEAARQAAFADRIVLSKRDLAGSVDGLIERLRAINAARSVERRVGKECRARGWADH